MLPVYISYRYLGILSHTYVTGIWVYLGISSNPLSTVDESIERQVSTTVCNISSYVRYRILTYVRYRGISHQGKAQSFPLLTRMVPVSNNTFVPAGCTAGCCSCIRTAKKGILRAQIHKTGLKIQELAILSCAQGFVFSMQNSTDKKSGVSLGIPS